MTFVLDGRQPDEVGATLDRQGIAVRAGHHCAQPILRRYGLEAAVRPSLAIYTFGEVDTLVGALRDIAWNADAAGRTGSPAGGPRPVSAGYMRAIVGGGGTHGCA